MPAQIRPRRRATSTALALSTAAATLVSFAGTADAGVPAPTRPYGATVAAVSGSSFTVRLPASVHADQYRLFASTTKSDLYSKHIADAPKQLVTSSRTMTLGGLPFTTAPYYYRLQTANGNRKRLDPTIHAVGLLPAAPEGLAVGATAAGGTYLTWHPTAATGFQVQQATDAAMTQNARMFTVRTGAGSPFTPYGLTSGSTYWWRVRSANADTTSAWSSPVSATVHTGEQPVNLLTYNVQEADTAGKQEGDGPIATWSQRRAGVVALIRQADPDIIAVQEAAAFVGKIQGYGGERQIDDLRDALGVYTLAGTETPPTVHGYLRTGVYILYKTALYRAVGTGGHWAIGDNRWAAYQILENKVSGARLLFVSPHLHVGSGGEADGMRQAETQSMIAQASALGTAAGVPVIYAGDFNSDINHLHAFDGPGIAMRAAGMEDANLVAQTRANAQYNSANDDMHKPIAVGQSIDYVFSSPGVGVAARNLVIDLVNGRIPGVIPSDHNPLQALVYIPYRTS